MTTRVLIIEDNPANLSLMSYLLGAHGYEVIGAADAETGLELVRSQRPHAVICDVQLPGMDGLELVGIFKSDPKLRMLPMIAVSALAMVGDRDRIMAAGFGGYMSKPIEADQFVGRVESYLRPELRSGVTPTVEHASPEPHAVRTYRNTSAPVLIVDDTPENLGVIRGTLEPFGFTVVTANSGESALTLLRDFTPDLILADLHLVGEPDFEFLDRVKADSQLSAIPFLLLSSTSNKQSLVRTARSKGAAGFLFRPIDPAALVSEIHSCLGDPK